MLRRVLVLALLHVFSAAEIDLRLGKARLQVLPRQQQIVRARNVPSRSSNSGSSSRDPLPVSRPPPPTPVVDSGSSYYQSGYQGYPFQQGQPLPSSSSQSFVQPGQPSQQSQQGQATQTSEPSAATVSGEDRAFLSSGSATSSTAVSSSSLARQGAPSLPSSSQPFTSPQQTFQPQPTFGQPQPSNPTFPQTGTNPAFPQPSLQQPLPTQPSKTSPAPAAQPQFPAQPSNTQQGAPQPVFSSQPNPASQPVFQGQPLPAQPQPSSNPQFSGQPLPSQTFPQPSLPAQPSSLPAQPQSQPQAQPQPQSQPAQPAQPQLQPQPQPQPQPALYTPRPKEFDMRGCYTGTTFCPLTKNCVATVFFNTSCPGYREPFYMNNINLECAAEAQASWTRLNYTGRAPQPPYLDTWADGPLKTILLDFISRVTNPAMDTFVPREFRVATFDNDGTIWPEVPTLNQVAFLLWFVKRFPDPGQILQNQLTGYLDGTTRGDPMSAVLSGLSVDMYNDFIRLWAEETRHPSWQRPYNELFYTPMVDLANLMQAACFNVFIVSGGENLFMRGLLPKMYGIAPANVIGSFMDLKYEQSAIPGAGMEFKIYPRTPVVVDRALKPVAVQRSIARPPIFAIGNSDGDFELLQYTTTGPGMRLGVLIKHDDPVREVVYEGHMERSISEAPARGWLFASMKRDFKEVFPVRSPVIYTPRPRTNAPTPQPTPFPTAPRVVGLPYVPSRTTATVQPLLPLTTTQPALSAVPNPSVMPRSLDIQPQPVTTSAAASSTPSTITQSLPTTPQPILTTPPTTPQPIPTTPQPTPQPILNPPTASNSTTPIQADASETRLASVRPITPTSISQAPSPTR